MVLLTKKNIIGAIIVVAVLAASGFFFFNLDPVSDNAGGGAQMVFQVNPGDGFREVAQHLSTEHLIRSPLAFDIFSLVDGRAFELKPGLYKVSPSMDMEQIVAMLSAGTAGEATVTIPPGSNIFDVDKILSVALVIHPGELINFTSTQNLEGRLFPDTYQFYTNDNVADVVKVMTDNFNIKAEPLLAAGSSSVAEQKETLIIASIVQVEVPDQADQELVAGIILKRLAAGMPLDIDATVCYAKLLAGLTSTTPAAPKACQLTALDFKIDSPYNSYLYKGLPPASIGNPGTSAITAALHPQSSPYFYYLSDPVTGKTIFAKTLDEQNQNRVKYIESN